MTEREEIDYLILVDISYGETCRRVFPQEWSELLIEIERQFVAAGFSAVGVLFYRTNTVGHLEKLVTVHKALFQLRDYLSSLDWVLEFNIVLLFGNLEDFTLVGTLEALTARLPGVNQIWRSQEDRPLFDQLSTHIYESFYSVDGWREEIAQSVLEKLGCGREHQQLLEGLSERLRHGDSCVLVGPTFSGKSFFVESLLASIESSSIVLRACPSNLEPQVIFQPLLDYCFEIDGFWNERCRAMLEQSRQVETLTHQQLHCDLPELLPALRGRSCLVICEGMEYWPDSAKLVLKTLLSHQAGVGFLLVGGRAVEWARLPTFCYPPEDWRKGGDRVPEELTPRMLDFVSKEHQKWRDDESFADFVHRLLSEGERDVLALLGEADGLLRRHDVLQLNAGSQPALEKLIARGLVRENDALFVCLKEDFEADEEERVSLRRKITEHWLEGDLAVDQNAKLICWGELPTDRLRRLIHSLSYRGLTSTIEFLRHQQVAQDRLWPTICEHWLHRSSFFKQDHWLPEGDEEADFVAAYHLCRAGQLELSNRRNKNLLYRYSGVKNQPIYFGESMLLHGILLLMHGNFRDAHYYFDQLERRAEIPAGLWWSSKVYQALAFFLAQDFDRCFSLIHEQQVKGEMGQWYWRLYLDFVELRLLFRVGAYQNAGALAAKLEERARHYQQPDLSAVFFRWRQRCAIYQGDYTSGWTNLKAHPACRERDVFMVEACVFAGKYQEALSLIVSLQDSCVVENRIDRTDWQDGFQACENLVMLDEGEVGGLECELGLLSALVYVHLRQSEKAHEVLSSLRACKYNRELYHYVLFLCQQTSYPGSVKQSLQLSHAVSLVRSRINSTRTAKLRQFLSKRHYWSRCILQAREQREIVIPHDVDDSA